MSDPVAQAPWYIPYISGALVALIGSAALLVEKIHKITTGYGEAEARNLNATADKTEAESDQISALRSADFERILNERTFRTWDILEAQIKHLTDLVESQSEQLTSQSRKMDHMEREIMDLRRALDDRTRELQLVKDHLPEVTVKLMGSSNVE